MTQVTDESRQEGLAGQAAAKMQVVAAAAEEKAIELREEGSTRLQEQLDRRSSEAGAQAHSVADALRRAGSDLGDQGDGVSAKLTGQAADRIDRIGSYLQSRSGDELMRDVESFARRRPWMLAGLGALTGVAAARFIKASSEQRYDGYRQTAAHGQARAGTGRGDHLAGDPSATAR